MANVCDLTQWKNMEQWVDRSLRDAVRTPNLRVRVASRRIDRLEAETLNPALRDITPDTPLGLAIEQIGRRRGSDAPAWWGEFADGVARALDGVVTTRSLFDDRGLGDRLSAVVERDSIQEARELVATWAEEQGLRWRAEIVRRPGLSGILRVVFPVDRPLVESDIPFRRVDTESGLSEAEREALERALTDEERWPELSKALAEIDASHMRVVDALDEVADVITELIGRYGLGDDTPETLLGVYETLWPRLTAEERETLGAALRKAGFPNSLLSEDTAIVARLVQAAVNDTHARLEALPKRFPWLQAHLEQIDSLERSIGLVRLGLLVENVLDMFTKELAAGHGLRFALRGAIGGLNEVRAARLVSEFPVGAEDALAHVGTTTMDDIMARYGRAARPESVAASVDRLFAAQEFQNYGPGSAPIWRLPGVQRLAGPPPVPETARNTMAGVATPIRVQPWQWPLRAPVMAIGWSTSWVRVLMTAQETAFRKASFDFKFLEYMHRVGDGVFRERAEAVIRAHGMDPAPFTRRFGESWSWTADRAHDLSLELYPDRPALADQLRALRNQVLDQAEDEGIRESQRVHFDYLGQNRLDELLGGFFKYHVWATRNIPFYTQELVRHYTVLRLWARWNAINEGAEQRLEQPPGVSRLAVPIPENAVLEAIFPRAAVSAQVLAVISLLSQVEEPWQGPGTAWDQARRRLGSVGMSPLFRWQILAWLLHYDTRADPPRFYNLMGIPARATGIDPTGLPGAILRGVRESVPVPPGGRQVSGETLTGSAVFDRAVWRELVVMSVEATGRANDPAYLTAMADPQDPLFQEAAARVRRRRVPEEALNWVLPYYVDAQGKTEAELRQAALHPIPPPPPPIEGTGALGLYRPEGDDVPPEAPVALAYAEGLPGLWARYVPSDVREAQINAGFALELDARRRGLAPSRAYLEDVLPWYVAYQAWARQQPPGQRSTSDFLAGTWSLPE